MRNGNGRYTEALTDAIRCLMQKPCTVMELVEMCDVREETIRVHLKKLEKAGLVCFSHAQTKKGNRGGQVPYVWHWCPVPFEIPETAKKAA